MAGQPGKMAKKTVNAARRAVTNVATKVLAVEGKRSLQRKAKVAGRVALDAVKAGLAAGAVAATTAVIRDVQRRRKPVV